MQTVIITIHLLVVIALVGVILIQRSEGGGLGIGGGSGFMSARGTKNTLTRMTAILAACFFVTSIILTVLQLVPGKGGSDILNQITQQKQDGDSGNLLDNLGGDKDNQSGTSTPQQKDAATNGAQNQSNGLATSGQPAEQSGSTGQNGTDTSATPETTGATSK